MAANIFELGTMGLIYRIFNYKDPGLIFMGFANAFGSMLHSWMLFALRRMVVPRWLLRFIRRLYKLGWATMLFRGRKWGMVSMESGIIQGCPVSGTLSALAVDPVLRWLSAQIVGPH